MDPGVSVPAYVSKTSLSVRGLGISSAEVSLGVFASLRPDMMKAGPGRSAAQRGDGYDAERL